MRYDGPAGMMLDLVGPSPDGVDLEWKHVYTDARPYVYASNLPTRATDPTGLFLNYGNYCGLSRNGPGAPVDAIDAACKKHDACLATAWDWANPVKQCVCNIQFCIDAVDARDGGCNASADPIACKDYASVITTLCGLGSGYPPIAPL